MLLKKVFIQSFGCRASQADGAAIEASLQDRGFDAGARSGGGGSGLVVNTCTVTHAADVDARAYIRGLHRDHPSAEILVTGCYAQRAPEELAGIEGVHWVVGNSHKTQIAAIVLSGSRGLSRTGVDRRLSIAQAWFLAAPVRDVREDRTRPNLKVQDGCSNRCSFCIIPSVRGRSRSATARRASSTRCAIWPRRYCEIVLTGINLGRWGRDLPERIAFRRSAARHLARNRCARLRISSVEPMDWSELLALVAGEPRIADHVHLPLQSGSDAVLKRMFRKYRTRHYATRFEIARG